jgi:hypothetical protein
MSAEVILVSSPAAVGKSTAAEFLAAMGELPILDLAAIHVSTHTFAGLLASDFVDPQGARDAFHKGRLPVIIDALDEGRLRSGDPNFEQFLETTWELMLEDRSVTDRPKLVFFGRELAAELVELSLELLGEGITGARVQLDFFDRAQAAEVIEAHAEATARADRKAWTTSGPVREVIDGFFVAIAAALSLEPAVLWDDQQGRALAGYAPVLAAIGRLLARESNPIRLRNALEETGAGRAWDVIERVAGAILDRERDEKVRPQLAHSFVGAVPHAAYDREEQLTYLIQYALGHPLHPTSRLQLKGSDVETYRRIIDQQIPEHPFLQNHKLDNDVLTSLVLAHAVRSELLEGPDLEILRHRSRQPFLWRSVQDHLSSETPELLRGEYVGPVLNSLWNDPISTEVEVGVTDDPHDPGFVALEIREPVNSWRVQTLPPLEFYGQLHRCSVDIAAPATLQGHEGAYGVASFDIRGDVTLVVRDKLTIEAAAIRIDGDARVFAEDVSQPGGLSVTKANGSKTWRGGALDEAVGWRDLPLELPPPIDIRPPSELERFVEQCDKRMPGAVPLVIYEGSYKPGDHHKMKWLERDKSGEKFPSLLQLFVEHGLAHADSFGASGPDPKLRLHFAVGWGEFRRALQGPPPDDESLLSLIKDARELFGEGRRS